MIFLLPRDQTTRLVNGTYNALMYPQRFFHQSDQYPSADPRGGVLVQDMMMSSVYNAHEASLAVDGNLSTCAETGMENNPWLKISFEATITVKNVTIIGQSGTGKSYTVTENLILLCRAIYIWGLSEHSSGQLD